MPWTRRNGDGPSRIGPAGRNASAASTVDRDSSPESGGGAPGGDGQDAAANANDSARYVALKRELHQKIIATIDLESLSQLGEEQLRLEVGKKAGQLCDRLAGKISVENRERLISEVLDETFGLGPLEPLMADPQVSDILINGAKTVYIERRGRLEKSSVTFHDNRHLMQIVHRIAGRTGRHIDETCPMVDSRLPDGSRLNAIIPPLAIDGPLVSIRRFGAQPITIEDLKTFQSITPEMLDFLAACVRARINILISGGTGSGKTTLLNCLSRFIPPEERVATIEDAAELQLQQPHVVRMETRAANIEGQGEVATRDLVRNALRMRPDRIIVGECRGQEALDMLQAMNTGHEGSMTTIHANTTRDALSRLEMMVGMAGFDLPIWVIRRQMASAIHVVVQMSRLMGGIRKLVRISEITGMEGDVLTMHDLFEFRQTGLDENRVAVGQFCATGIRPHLLGRLEASGAPLPVQMFERRVLKVAAER
jgi:pilus assembly protein CpaF